MKVSFGTVNGDQWEEYCQKVFRLRYRAEDYQEVPAKYGGDLGIEGFTKTGIVFQCYCPDDEPTSKELYVNQRKKITTDIKKFIDNEKELKTLLGVTKVRRWFLVTPSYDDKDLIAHCQKKTQEVKAKKCSHVADDFEVLLCTEKDFIVENGILVSAGAQQIAIDPPEITPTEILDWSTAENDHYDNIRSKILKIPNVLNVDRYVTLNIKNFLAGQNVLTHLHKEYPGLYEKLLSVKNAQERKVEGFSMMPSGAPGEFLKECFEEYVSLIREELGKSLSVSLTSDLAGEAIADWLIRCPLDF